MRKFLTILLVSIAGLSCLFLSGCDITKKPSPYKWYGTVKKVTVGMTLEEALEDVSISYDGDGFIYTEKGYDAMIEAGAHITWDGSTKEAQEFENNGRKLNIRITWKSASVLYIPYSFNDATVSDFQIGGQSHKHHFMDKNSDGKCDSCKSLNKDDGNHY